jgi:hypothetical protein
MRIDPVIRSADHEGVTFWMAVTGAAAD